MFQPAGIVSVPQVEGISLMAKSSTTASSNAASTASKSANSTGHHADRWYIADPATKRVSPLSDPTTTKAIADLNAANLPDSIKTAALAGLQAQQKAAKAFTLTISRAQKPGARDLVEVAGGFKSKLLSPSLVQAIVNSRT